MHDVRLSRSKFERAHEPDGRSGNWQHEDPKRIRAVRRKHVGLRQRHDDVRLAQLPSFSPCPSRCGGSGTSFGPAFRHPPSDQTYFIVRKRMLIDERTVRRVGLPRRHVAPLGYSRDQSRSPFHIVVREQAEWPRPTRVMAHRAAIGDERRYVGCIYDRFRERVARSCKCKDATTKTRRHEEEEVPWLPSWLRVFVAAFTGHRAKSAMKQPTAWVVGRATGLPARTAVSASARSCVVGAGRSSPRST